MGCEGTLDQVELLAVWYAVEAHASDLVVWRPVVGEARDAPGDRNQEPRRLASPGRGVGRTDEVDLGLLDAASELRVAEQGNGVGRHNPRPLVDWPAEWHGSGVIRGRLVS